MEQSGRKWRRSVANRTAVRPAQTSQNRGPTVAFSCARNEMVRRMLATDCHRPLLLERRLMPGFEKEIEPREPEGPQDSIPTLTAGLSLCPSSS